MHLHVDTLGMCAVHELQVHDGSVACREVVQRIMWKAAGVVMKQDMCKINWLNLSSKTEHVQKGVNNKLTVCGCVRAHYKKKKKKKKKRERERKWW